MNRKVTVAFVAVLLTGLLFGASAFTSAEVTRNASINVAADNNAIITLSPGSTNAVSLNGSGELEINTTPGSANGVNVGGVFTYGDTASPTSNYAFSVTNADSQQRSLTVAYNNVTENQGVTNAVEFQVYDSSGNQVGTADIGNDVSITASSGSTYYVVMQLNTDGLDSNADLSGDLVITA